MKKTAGNRSDFRSALRINPDDSLAQECLDELLKARAEQLTVGLPKAVSLGSAGSELLPSVAQLTELDGMPPVAESLVVEDLPSVLPAAASRSLVISAVDFSAVMQSDSMAQTSLAEATSSTPALVLVPELVSTQAAANPIERPAASTGEKPSQRERRLFVGSTDSRAMLADYLIDFRTRVQGQLESAFPTLANRRSIVVTLLILRDGTVRDVELDRSSGDSGVDKKVLSALKALRQLQVLPTAASEDVDVLGVPNQGKAIPSSCQITPSSASVVRRRHGESRRHRSQACALLVDNAPALHLYAQDGHC